MPLRGGAVRLASRPTVILSRRRRISVRGAFEAAGIKYRLPVGGPGSEGKVASPCGAGGYGRLRRRVV